MAGMQELRLCTIVRRPIYGASRRTPDAPARAKPESSEMFAPEVTRAVPLGSITTFRIVALVQRALDAFAAWRSAHATEKALLRLSDQQLADIGLHRGDIAAVAEDLARA